MHPPYYRGCWHGVSRCFLWRYRQLPLRGISSLLTELYNPKAFITHTALLDQGFPHCPIFPTAASRRSLDRVSVPVWLIILSDQLSVVALVSRYLTNKLMERGPIFRRPKAFFLSAEASKNVFGISSSFLKLSPIERYVIHALLTRAPLVSI